MVEQCQLLEIIAGGQRGLAEYLKASAVFVTPGLRPIVHHLPASAGPTHPVAPTGHGTPLTPASPQPGSRSMERSSSLNLRAFLDTVGA